MKCIGTYKYMESPTLTIDPYGSMFPYIQVSVNAVKWDLVSFKFVAFTFPKAFTNCLFHDNLLLLYPLYIFALTAAHTHHY